jgi:hypothetical protein
MILSLVPIVDAMELRHTNKMHFFQLVRVLEECHQLHVRWASERRYDTFAPFSSRISPGLHVFFTPVYSSHNEDKL